MSASLSVRTRHPPPPQQDSAFPCQADLSSLPRAPTVPSSHLRMTAYGCDDAAGSFRKPVELSRGFGSFPFPESRGRICPLPMPQLALSNRTEAGCRYALPPGCAGRVRSQWGSQRHTETTDQSVSVWASASECVCTHRPFF